MNISIRFVSLVFMAPALLLPALVNAASTSSSGQEADSLHSAYQIAAVPRTIFVRNIDDMQRSAEYNSDVKAVTGFEMKPSILAAILAQLRIELSMLPAGLGLDALKRRGSWSQRPRRADVVMDKVIAFSDLKTLTVVAKPLDAKGQLTPQATKLVDSIKLGENDTAIVAGTTAAATMIRTRLLQDGAQANQITLLATSFKPSALDLQLSGIKDQNQNGTVDPAESESFAAIQLMHRPTLADLSPATATPNQSALPISTP